MTFATHTGNRGLVLEEKLIFEQGQSGRTGVDLREPSRVLAVLTVTAMSAFQVCLSRRWCVTLPACRRKTSVLIPASSRWDPAP